MHNNKSHGFTVSRYTLLASAILAASMPTAQMLLDLFPCPAQFASGDAGALHEEGTQGRQHRAPLLSFKYRRADFLFQELDALGHRGLRQPGLAGRRSQTAGFSHGNDIAKVVQLHGDCSPKSNVEWQ